VSCSGSAGDSCVWHEADPGFFSQRPTLLPAPCMAIQQIVTPIAFCDAAKLKYMNNSHNCKGVNGKLQSSCTQEMCRSKIYKISGKTKISQSRQEGCVMEAE